MTKLTLSVPKIFQMLHICISTIFMSQIYDKYTQITQVSKNTTIVRLKNSYLVLRMHPQKSDGFFLEK